MILVALKFPNSKFQRVSDFLKISVSEISRIDSLARPQRICSTSLSISTILGVGDLDHLSLQCDSYNNVNDVNDEKLKL